MSSGELLLILFVACIVFGPSKLPMLARHLGMVIRKAGELKEQAYAFWDEQLHQIQLQENEQKAKKADETYEDLGSNKIE